MTGDSTNHRDDGAPESGALESGALEANVEQLLRATPPTPAMDPAARARVLEALLRRQAERPAPVTASVVALPRRRTNRREAVLLGSIAAAAGFMGLFLSSDVLRPTRVHENDGHGPKEVVLLDGSKALLDEGARIEERGKASVRVEKGSVIFDVVHGKAMRVDAGQARVKSLGTKFLVRAGDAETQVAVARGKVELTGRGGDTIVAAGQQSLVRGDDRPEAEPAPRMSHLFGFARSAEEAIVEETPGSPRRHGTLIARDPRWGMDRPLEIRDLTIDIVVEDGVARTTIDQTFFNADVRQLEGKYQFPLPQGAAVSRLGMYVGSDLMEAAVVDRDRGRNIYEGIVYQRRDPALLEWMSGNSFSMRVFPLPGRTEKRIFLSYTQTIERLYDVDRLVVPIPPVDLPAQKVSFRVRVNGGAATDIRSPSHEIDVSRDGADGVASFAASSYTLGDDFVVAMRRPQGEAEPPRSFDEGGARFVAASVAPDLEKARRNAVPGRWVVLYDTSGSRSAETLAAQRRFVRSLAAELDDDAEITVLALDHDARAITERLSASNERDRATLDAALVRAGENAAGDTRLDVGLHAAAAAFGADIREGDTVVYVGDGVPTGALRDPAALSKALPSGVRFAGVAVGDTVDTKLLDAIANQRTGLAIAVGTGENLADRAFDFVSALRTPCLRGLTAQVVGASGQPARGATAHLLSSRACDGERVDVVARVEGAGSEPLAIKIEGRTEAGEDFIRTVDLGTSKGGAAYLPRLWAQREVDALLARPGATGVASSEADARAAETRASVVALAMKHVLATPYTSLLVLENDAMYKEFGVEKRAPSGWAVYDAPKKIDVRYEPLGSEPIALDASWDLVHRMPTEIFAQGGFGGLRLSGIGEGGGGRGLGSIGTIGTGTGQGFGSGSGRLGGRHRDVIVQSKSTEMAERTRADRRAPRGEASGWAGPTPSRRSRNPWGSSLANGTPSAPQDFGMIGLLSENETQTLTTLLPSTYSVEFLDDALSGAHPTAFVSSYDARFDDLTELVPALTLSSVDLTREAIEVASETTGAPGRAAAPAGPPEAAVNALARARRALLGGSWRGEGPGAKRVSVDAKGSVAWRDQAGDVTIYDGSVLTSYSGELDLAVQRRVGGAAPWLLAADAPFVAPAPETLAGLTVTVRDDGSVLFAAPKLDDAGDEAPELEDIELSFDADGRITRVRWIRQGASREARLSYGAANEISVFWPDGREQRFLPDGSAQITAEPASTSVMVPVATPVRLDARLESAKPGSQTFVDLQREKLAACAALADDDCSHKAASAILSARGSMTKGELVLASHALDRLAEPDQKRALASLPAADAVRRVLEANLVSDSAKRRTAFASLGLRGTPLGAWVTYRSILMDLEGEASPSDATERRVAAAIKDPAMRSEMRFLVVRTAAERARWSDQQKSLRIWELLSEDPEVGFIADRHRALVDPWSRPEESAALLVRSFETSLERGLAPAVEWQTRDIIRRARGDVGVRLFWAKWRDHLEKRGTAMQILLFVDSLARGVRPDGAAGGRLFDDVDPILERFEQSGGAGVIERLGMARLLLTLDRARDAERALKPLVQAESPVADALDTASEAAERLGRFDDAATLVTRSMDVSKDVEVSMSLVRQRYQRLLTLQVKHHQGDPARQPFALAAVIETARNWRREDPDNAEVDLTVAAAMDRLGMKSEAHRQLFSIIDRHPGEGDAFAKVAAALESRGDFDEALGLWDRAASVEPTNPTWLLSKAHLLRARGKAADAAAARALLEKIDTGKWQDRFVPQVNEARQLLRPATR